MTKKPESAQISETEIAFVRASLSKLKNPKHRYFVTIIMDLLVDALIERNDITIPELLELGLAVGR